MAIVARGLGQPEESPLVTGGLGSTTPPPAGSMSANITAAGTIAGTLTTSATGSMVADITATGTITGTPTAIGTATADIACTVTVSGTLTDGNAPVQLGGGSLRHIHRPQHKPQQTIRPGWMSAHIHMTATVSAHITFDVGTFYDTQLAQLLTLELV